MGQTEMVAVYAALFVSSVTGAVGVMIRRLPSWWGPHWLREMPAAERKPDSRSVGGAWQRYTDAETHIELSSLASEVPSGPSVWLCRARWVHDSTASRPETGLSLAGAVSGGLLVAPGQVWFAATEMETRVRGKQVLFSIDVGEITDVRRVGALRRPDGSKQSGVLAPQQRICPRLVIECGDTTYLFEVFRARQALEHVAVARASR